MSEQHYDANQGAMPPPPASSQSPTPPPPPGPQNVITPAVVAPQAGVTFTPMSKESRRRTKRIVVSVVAPVMLGVVATVALAIANWTYTPETQVRQYLDLLTDGKASTATAMVDSGLPNDRRGFLFGEVMASSSAHIEIEDVTVDDAEHSKKQVVTATIRLDGEHFTCSFRVSRAKKTLGLLKDWKIQDAIVSHMDVRVDSVIHFSIGGEEMPITTLKEVPSSSIVLYPSVYTFTLEETSECIDAAPKAASVKTATGYDNSYYGGTVELRGIYGDKVATAMLGAAAALANSCATVPGNIDTACSSAVQSWTLALLQVKTMPTAMRATTDEGGVYAGEATFTIQGMESWEKQHDATSRVAATVKTDKDDKLELDAPSELQFEVRFAY